MFTDALEKAAKKYQVELTKTQIENFQAYNDLLIEWNKKINLTAIVEPEQVAIKHMIDSLSCYDKEIFKNKSKIIDVGTGAGFPGLPLKIWQDNIELTLLDSLNKRVKFLDTVTETLKLNNVVTIHSRAEDAGQKDIYREKYDIAVSRAVARLNILCEICLPFVRTGGYFIALKGAQYQEEAEEAKKAVKVLGGKIEKIVPVKLPGLEDSRAVVYIKKIKNTNKLYPRKAGTIEKSPL